MRNKNAKNTAICGVFAGVAIIIMCFGGLIPIATYLTPMLCILIAQIILTICGKRFAITWYVAVSILSLLLGPDKEASMLFCFLGNYPCLKQYIDRSKFRILWKLLYFNIILFLVYFVTCSVLGMKNLIDEYSALGAIGLSILILMGNVIFCMLDKILSFRFKRRH